MHENEPRRHTSQRRPVRRSTAHHRRSAPRRRHRSNNSGCIASVLVGLLLLAAFLYVFTNRNAASQDDSSSAISPASTAQPAQEAVAQPTAAPTATPVPTQTPAPTPDPAIAQAQAMLADPLMILVRASHPMPDGYTVDSKVADTETGKELAVAAADAFISMQARAAESGITLRLQSGYRSVSYQQGLFDRQIEKWIAKGYDRESATKQAATVVAIPGASEHNCGLAADINCPEFYALEEGFENTTAFAWLAENAQDYGFILRYPRADEDTTGIIYEPWHWRYVGVENAKVIKESGLCLEDFLVELEQIAAVS